MNFIDSLGKLAFQNPFVEPGNVSTQYAEAGGLSNVQGYFQLYNETLPQNNRK